MNQAALRTVGVIVTLLLAGCVPRQPPEPEAVVVPTPKILVEEDIPVVERPELAIADVEEQANPQGASVVVSGTVINRGRGRARNLTVTVQVLDEAGNELLVLPAKTQVSVLEPDSSTTFHVEFQRPPGTARYHVVAQSR
ncbi:MAG: FxLYD domain-containing protein [Candidatus Binatia bacterium]|nr:FxLYD domain-containing protein [Candidatus Binatia bacterium]